MMSISPPVDNEAAGETMIEFAKLLVDRTQVSLHLEAILVQLFRSAVGRWVERLENDPSSLLIRDDHIFNEMLLIQERIGDAVDANADISLNDRRRYKRESWNTLNRISHKYIEEIKAKTAASAKLADRNQLTQKLATAKYERDVNYLVSGHSGVESIILALAFSDLGVGCQTGHSDLGIDLYLHVKKFAQRKYDSICEALTYYDLLPNDITPEGLQLLLGSKEDDRHAAGLICLLIFSLFLRLRCDVFVLYPHHAIGGGVVEESGPAPCEHSFTVERWIGSNKIWEQYASSELENESSSSSSEEEEKKIKDNFFSRHNILPEDENEDVPLELSSY